MARGPGPFGRLTAATRPPRPGTPLFRAWRLVTDANVWGYRVSGGRLGGRIDGAPVLLLHHVGRRSGDRRITPLLYLADGDDVVVVASMGGTPKNPAWFHNLSAAPDTHVEVGRERRAVRARIAGPQERGRLWPRLVDLYPAFGTYQARAPREIPVVVLSPR